MKNANDKRACAELTKHKHIDNAVSCIHDTNFLQKMSHPFVAFRY